MLVAVRLGRVVGWAFLNIYNPRYGYRFVADFSIYIERSFRGSGVGSALLPFLIEQAVIAENKRPSKLETSLLSHDVSEKIDRLKVD